MTFESLRNYCANKPHATEHFPFDETTLVFKIGGKMFALLDIEDRKTVNLKGLPDKLLELRAEYEDIQPGYHMNKKHWITVTLHGSLSDQMLRELVDNSYQCVLENLPKKVQAALTDNSSL